MNTRFYNCKILTLCKDDEILKNCELWVEENKIAYIGKPKESPISFDREIDCNGNLVMPSFKNGHGHGIMTFCRSIADVYLLINGLMKRYSLWKIIWT